MRLLIDNNDGAGAVDYTQAVRADAPLTVARARGAWTVAQAGLDAASCGMPVPANRAHVTVLDANGTVMFRGYACHDAAVVTSLAGSAGAVDCTMLRSVESAWLTQPAPGKGLQPATSTQHVLPLGDVALHVDVVASPDADLATDVTVYGELEPAEYVTELFRGDGATQAFSLQHAPFRENGKPLLLDDAFDGPALDAALWSRVDTGHYFSLGDGGLKFNGGTGFDGATVLQRKDAVELGGALVAEARGVVLQAGSDGILLGFYDGPVTRATCVAGVRVRGAAGDHSVVAIVNGVEQTLPYSIAAGHMYTMRVRLYCPELQRVRNRYEVLVDGALQQFGGDAVDAPLHVVVEVLDTGLASSTLPTVLYDGALAVSPVQALFAPVNSASLGGSLGRLLLAKTGSCRVTTIAADGTRRTRREGVAATGADYTLSTSGVLTFAPGLLPQPGEMVQVEYRRGRRAAARRADDTATFVKASLGLPGLPAWSGVVLSPAARSAADCDAAAKALLALAAGAATATAGTVSWTRAAGSGLDVQPGDTLLLHSDQGTQIAPVTTVHLIDLHCVPECIAYRAGFGQTRAGSMDFRVGEGAPMDAVLPVAALPDASTPPSLQALQVTVATGSALQIDAGDDAVAGGGFEVRRSDANFGSQDTSDLVLRSPARSFLIPRAAFAERFFVRMFDGAVPPRFSAVSSAVMTSLPIG